MKPGRKRKIPGVEPLDEIDGIAAIGVLAIVREQERWTYAEVAERISGFEPKAYIEEKHKLIFKESAEVLDDNTIYRAIINQKVPHDAAAKSIYLWIFYNYFDMFSVMRRNENLNRRESLVSALKKALGHSDYLNADETHNFSGKYKLYQPFHLDPKKAILACELEIGGDQKEFDCKLMTSFQGIAGRQMTEVAVGKIVPHGPKMMAVLASRGSSKSSFIMHFDAIQHHVSDDDVLYMGGVMIAATSLGRSSAWPIAVLRLGDDESFSPHVLPATEFQRLPKEVRVQLDRGGVYWDPDHFPRPFSRARRSGPTEP